MLGVRPNSDLAEIRAAYRALMRRYHPDADSSSGAADRARDINVAYSILSNTEKRASYDESLMEHRRIRFDPPTMAMAERRRARLAPIAAIGFALVAAGMVVFALSPAGPAPNRSNGPETARRELIAPAGETIRVPLPRRIVKPAAVSQKLVASPDRRNGACPDGTSKAEGMACEAPKRR
jgi:hypothetical protein